VSFPSVIAQKIWCLDAKEEIATYLKVLKSQSECIVVSLTFNVAPYFCSDLQSTASNGACDLITHIDANVTTKEDKYHSKHFKVSGNIGAPIKKKLTGHLDLLESPKPVLSGQILINFKEDRA
jgi:hypothetical protein